MVPITLNQDGGTKTEDGCYRGLYSTRMVFMPKCIMEITDLRDGVDLLKEFYIDEKEESDDDDDQSESESGDNTDGADDIVAKGTIGGFNADGDGPLVHAVGSEAECDKIEQSIQRRVAHRSAAMAQGGT